MKRWSLLLAPAVLWTAPAAAHPHIWIKAHAQLIVERGELTAIEQHWSFDELFSDFVRTEYDRNGDGAFDEEETRTVATDAFGSLAEFGFLTHLRIGERAVELKGFTGLKVDSTNGIVSYQFTLPLPEPVDAEAGDVKLGLYDDTFYIDVALAETDAIVFAGAGSEACRYTLEEDVAHPIYFGMVNPLVAHVRCPVS